jgi:glycosyltransferase involved in cell wall biosynthesis
MKVAIIVPRWIQLGPVKVIQTLVNSLSDEIDINVFYLNKSADSTIQMKVQPQKLSLKKFSFSDYDIIHTNGIRPDFLAYINRKKIKFHISTIHNFVFADLAFTYNRFISIIFGSIWLKLWSKADKLVCISKSMESYYKQWFPMSKLEVIYNGISDLDNDIIPDSDIIESISVFRDKKLIVIGSAGILTKRKGIDEILYLLEREKQFAFVLIGSGRDLKKLKHLADKLRISERCYFCGYRFNAVNYFRYFDFVVFPSRSEGFGLALIEAVQQKVPVLCSDLAVFKELFNDNEVTFYKSRDMTSLRDALKIIHESGTMKTDLAYSRYLSAYHHRFMAKGYYTLYKSA